jgi:hypothetical protein
MGFEVPEPRHMRLVFADPSFKGLEVVCRLVPVGQLSEAASLADVDPKAIRLEDAEKVQRLIDAFAGALVSWNLTRRSRKVPATPKGVGSLDLLFTMQLIEAWLTAVGQVIAEQAQGDAELAETLQTEPLG